MSEQPQKRPSVPWRVGALAIVSGLILLGVLVMTGPLRLYRGTPLAIDFGYAGPIKPGAAVRLSGVVVGAVEEVELLAGQDASAGAEVMVRVRARIRDEAMAAVTSKARFYVTTLGVLGEHYLDVAPAPGGERLAAGSVVRGVDLARPDLLLPRAAALLEVMSVILDENRAEAVDLMRRVSGLIVELDTLLESADAPLLTESRLLLLEGRSLVIALRHIVGDGSELREVLTKANRLGAGLESADLAGLVKQGHGTLDRLDRTLAQVNESPVAMPERQRELLAKLERSLAAFEGLSARADRLLAMIEQGQGGAGKAFHDEQLVADLKSVLHQLRQNPFRLLIPGEKK